MGQFVILFRYRSLNGVVTLSTFGVSASHAEQALAKAEQFVTIRFGANAVRDIIGMAPLLGDTVMKIAEVGPPTTQPQRVVRYGTYLPA